MRHAKGKVPSSAKTKENSMYMTVLEKELYARLLVEREVCFVYRKDNGEIRKARGTCNLDCIPPEHHPVRHLPVTTSIRYFDWDRMDWRSFRLGTLLEVVK